MTMTADELGRILRRMYDESGDGQKVANIHLFAIKYATAIQEARLTSREVVMASGIRPSYAAEVSKGINLSKYVVPRPQY